MKLRSRPRPTAVVLALAVLATLGALAAVFALAAVTGMMMGLDRGLGARAPRSLAMLFHAPVLPLLVVLLAGLLLAVAGYLVHRGVRRRARIEAIMDLLPRYREHRHDDEFLFDNSELEGELSERTPATRADIRAATRALLVSLEESIELDQGRARRTGRPACRRARLRSAGRSARGRRRIVSRLMPTTPS